MSNTAFLFPGQGAQSVGMAQSLIDESASARELFQRAAAHLGYDLAAYCNAGPVEKLDSTEISQPALFVTSLAALEKLRAESLEVVEACQSTAGLSLGEYTALVFAGAMSFEDGLRVMQERGKAMQEAADANPSSMVSILGMNRDDVEAICQEAGSDGETIQIANMLCPGNIVVSGSLTGCERASEIAEAKGAMKVIRLAVAGAFHTDLMSSAVSRLANALADVEISSPRIQFISNVDAKSHQDPGEIKDLLIRQVVSPVLWEDSMRLMLESGVETFYEVGPGRVLRGLLKRIHRKAPCHGVLS